MTIIPKVNEERNGDIEKEVRSVGSVGNGVEGRSPNGKHLPPWAEGMPIREDGVTGDEWISRVTEWLYVLLAEDQVVELRALKVKDWRSIPTISGFFDRDHIPQMAKAALDLTTRAEGVYFTLNPLKCDLLSRRCNRVDAPGEGETACDNDVLTRRWLLVDADPVRLSGVSSTDGEREATFEVISRVVKDLRDAGWPEPVIADSGNGNHLLYSMDLPAEDDGLVKRVLAALASRHDTQQVKIDQAVFNPSRIVKLYGTMARKGDSTRDRPHRWSEVISIPEKVEAVRRELLEALAKKAGQAVIAAPRPVASTSFRPQVSAVDRETKMRRASAYLEKVEPAISGQEGHKQTFKAACTLVLGFDLSVKEALEVIKPWNERCSPPWNEKDLRHKLEDADKKTDERGYLLHSGMSRPGGDLQVNPTTSKAKEGDGERCDDDPSRLAEVVLERQFKKGGDVVLRYYKQEWWRWSEGAYYVLPEEELRTKAWAEVDEEFGRLHGEASGAASGSGRTKVNKRQSVTRNLVTNVLEAIKVRTIVDSRLEVPAWLDDELAKTHGEVIALRNGLLRRSDVEKGGVLELLPASHDWFSKVVLPYDFDPKADCPLWKKFLAKNLESDQERIALLQEWFGYCLLQDTGMQRFLILEGEGANGKSVVCGALTALLGEANVSNVTLESFAERFSLTSTLGKLANIASEVGEIDKAAEGKLKALTSGDRMNFDRKGIDLINATPTARLVFATNNLPRFVDRSEGVWRRILLIPFRVTIPDSEKVYGMDKPGYWADNKEVAGIFNWAVEGLRRLRAKRRFSETAVSKEAMKEYRKDCDPTRRFLEEYYERSLMPAGRVIASEIYSMYRRWCEQSGHKPASDATFGKDVKRVFGVTKKRGSDAKRQYYYDGLQEKEHARASLQSTDYSFSSSSRVW